MRVSMKTVVVDDDFRSRLRRYHGQTGLATREEVRSWYESNGDSCNSDLFVETDEGGWYPGKGWEDRQ
jgi:hypothetical protein